jgi:hypothetical protein
MKSQFASRKEFPMSTRRYFNLRIPLPNGLGWLRRLLSTPGNVIFTLVIIALLVAAQSAGALPLGRLPATPAAASTGMIAYQGRLADAAGAPLTGTYNMIFRLYDAATGGTPLWEEQWTGSNGVRVSDGLFNVTQGCRLGFSVANFSAVATLIKRSSAETKVSGGSLRSIRAWLAARADASCTES